MANLEAETCISMSDLIFKTQAPVIFVSAPQCGPARAPRGGAVAPYDAVKVMEILEALPEHVISALKLSFAVDFAGSRNSQFAESRIHAFDSTTGTLFSGKCDFDTEKRQDLVNAPKSNARKLQKETLPSCEEPYRRCVENSYWMSMWRGQITGAISASMLHAPDVDVVEASLHDIIRFNVPNNMRFVVAVSIDGGPITQVEKAWLPDVFGTALSNIQRRGYAWGPCAKIFWCNFPTLEDCLRSFGGVKNLAMDMDPSKYFDWGFRQDDDGDFEDACTTFTCISSRDEKCADEDMLYSSVSEILASKVDIYDKLCNLMSTWDEDSVLFVLENFDVDPNKKVHRSGTEKSLLEEAITNGLDRVVLKLRDMGANMSNAAKIIEDHLETVKDVETDYPKWKRTHLNKKKVLGLKHTLSEAGIL